jgi:hypothetical protein
VSRFAGEGVVPTPPVEDLVDLHAVLRGLGAAVAPDGPVVALDVDPGVALGHACAGERVVGQGAAGGALLDVHRLRGRLGDVVVAHQVVVAAVRVAAADVAPVALGGADVDALAVLRLAPAGVSHRRALDDVVGAVGAQVDGLVTDAADGDAVDQVPDGTVGHQALLPAPDGEPEDGTERTATRSIGPGRRQTRGAVQTRRLDERVAVQTRRLDGVS